MTNTFLHVDLWIHSLLCLITTVLFAHYLPYLSTSFPLVTGGLALALVQFFYVKYLVLFGLSSMLATLDKLIPPKRPRCVSIMYSFTGMWR